MHVGVAELHEGALCALGQLGDDLDSADIRIDRKHLGEDGQRIAAAGADLQDPLDALQLQRFGHSGHHERLRDGLSPADVERPVGLGFRLRLFGHEEMTGNAGEGGEHTRIADALVDQPPHEEAFAGSLSVRVDDAHRPLDLCLVRVMRKADAIPFRVAKIDRPAGAVDHLHVLLLEVPLPPRAILGGDPQREQVEAAVRIAKGSRQAIDVASFQGDELFA